MLRRFPISFRLKSFLRQQDGAATIEAVMWLPMFFYIMALAIDSTMVFHGYSRIIRAVEDVNRGLSVGRIASIDEGKSKIRASLADYKDLTADIRIVDGVVVTDVGVPLKNLIFLGALKPIVGKGIEVRTQQYVEF